MHFRASVAHENSKETTIAKFFKLDIDMLYFFDISEVFSLESCNTFKTGLNT